MRTSPIQGLETLRGSAGEGGESFRVLPTGRSRVATKPRGVTSRVESGPSEVAKSALPANTKENKKEPADGWKGGKTSSCPKKNKNGAPCRGKPYTKDLRGQENKLVKKISTGKIQSPD